MRNGTGISSRGEGLGVAIRLVHRRTKVLAEWCTRDQLGESTRGRCRTAGAAEHGEPPFLCSCEHEDRKCCVAGRARVW